MTQVYESTDRIIEPFRKLQDSLKALADTPEEFNKRFEEEGMPEEMCKYMNARALDLLSVVAILFPLFAVGFSVTVYHFYEVLIGYRSYMSFTEFYAYTAASVLSVSVVACVVYRHYYYRSKLESLQGRYEFWKHYASEELVKKENEYLGENKMPYRWMLSNGQLQCLKFGKPQNKHAFM